MIQNLELMLVKKDGKLVIEEPSDSPKYKEFYNSLKEGQRVNVYYSVELDPKKKTLGQLAKVHVLIAQLANEIGYTPAEMKKLIKNEAGLMKPGGEEYKSFKDCSKTELGTAIEACIKIGLDLGSNIY